MVSYIKGEMDGKDIWKQDSEVSIWAQVEWQWGVRKALQ